MEVLSTCHDLAGDDYVQLTHLQARLRPHVAALAPGLAVVALMLVWAVHDGGYDEDTWYWGALMVLGLLTAVVIARGIAETRVSRAGLVALGAFALYVAWSYLSITWADSPGDALTGSNRALLYLLLFATMLVLPWTVRGALTALLAFALGIGVVAIVLLFRLASADHVADLVISGRLAAPTGYFNSTAALFTIQALVAIALAARRELPGPVRGALIAFACAGLQLAVIVQSRGWLFTLPLVAIVAIVVLPDRLRVAGTAVLPVAGALVPVHRLLAVYQNTSGPALNHAAARAGHAALVICAVEFFVATLLAWGDCARPSSAAERGSAPRAWNDHDRARGRGCRRWRTRGNARTSDPVRRAAMEWLQSPADRVVGVALHRRRQRAVRLLEGLSGCVPGPSDRRARAGQLRQLLRVPPADGGGALVYPQSRAAAARAHRAGGVRAVRDLPRGRDRRRNASPPAPGARGVRRRRGVAAAGGLGDPRLDRLVLGDPGPQRTGARLPGGRGGAGCRGHGESRPPREGLFRRRTSRPPLASAPWGAPACAR